jgi:hypothetical protein
MNLISKSTPSGRLNMAVVLAALSLLIVPAAVAKHRAANSPEQPATVIAHIALPGAPANQILSQERDGKQYLYLVRNSRKGFMVVDVTKPSQPNLLQRVAWPDSASAGRLQVVSGTLGLAEGSSLHSASAMAAPPPETVELLDLSDPANPRTIQSFSGVSSVFTDESHNLIYLTNAEGLWIVRSRPEKYVLHPCTTADATNPMPSCE